MPRTAKPSRSNAAVQLKATAAISAAAGDPKTPRTFRMVANTGEPMNIWPYPHPVVVDLSSVDLSGLPVPALYDHCPDVDYTVGQVQRASVQGTELVAEGVFTVTDGGEPGRNYGRKVLDKADAGFVWQTSVGGDPASVEEIKAGASVLVNGRTYAGPVCVARGLVLREISFVVLGGDRRTSAVVARNLKGSAMKFEDFVKSLEVDPENMTESQAANLKRVHGELYPEGGEEKPEETAAADETAEEKPEETTAAEGDEKPEEEPTNAAAKKPALKAKRGTTMPDPVAQLRAKTAAELKRQSAILAMAAKYGQPTYAVKHGDGTEENVPLLAHAIEKEWTLEKTELEALRASRTAPSVAVSGKDKDCTIQALQGAMLLRAGGKLDHKAYQSPKAQFMNVPAWLRRGINDAERNRVMEASHHYHDTSLVDIARECLRIEGRSIPSSRGDMLKAAFSGGALTNVFTTNVNAILLASYMEAEDTTQGWVTEADVADYQLQERPRVLIGDGLSHLPEGQTADHAKLSDTMESYKVHRFAKMWQVDEIAMINDRLDAISDTPRRFGEAASWLRPDLVYGELMSNPTLSQDATAMFSATHPNPTQANLLTSAALAADKLKAAIKAQRLFTENGRGLNLKTTHLMVPPTLIWTARELANSAQIIIAGTAGSVTERGDLNTLQADNLTIVSDARLENGVTHPISGTLQTGSASTWYVVSRFAPTMEVGYLRGTGRAPRVRNYTLDRGQFGIGFDVQLTIGIKALDWRGFVKNTQ